MDEPKNQAHSIPGDVGMREAAQAVLDAATDYYTARNGRRMGIEGDDGEKCWIVPFDQFEDLRRALATPDSWLTISVDEAAQTIGIDHPTKAAWEDVYQAMVAVRDHINDRIAKQEGCPVRPAALTPSALSGDAGEGELGRFGHHPDPTIDFEHEVECCENDAYDLRSSTHYSDRRKLLVRIDRAMSFRVGGDENCISAKQSLRELERAILDGDCREYIDGVIAARAALPSHKGAGE